MKRKFTVKEKGLLLLLVLLLLGIFYYKMVWKSTSETIDRYNITILEDELLSVQAKAQRIINMEKVIEEQGGQTTGIVADYNNLQNEITELNRILSATQSYQLNFEEPSTDGTVIRRNINITFRTGDYNTAKRILDSLENCEYKCLLRDINLSAVNGGLQTSNQVDVNLQVTFYEAVTDEAESAGLQSYTDEGIN